MSNSSAGCYLGLDWKCIWSIPLRSLETHNAPRTYEPTAYVFRTRCRSAV